MYRLIAAALFLSCLALPAAAELSVRCSFDQKAANGSWIPQEAVLVTEEFGALVYDPLIAHFVGEPIGAEIVTDNARRATYSWEVQVKDASN